MSDTTGNDGSKPINNQSANEMTDENFAVLQQEIKALYQLQNVERPPEAIDAAILAQAKLSSKHAKSSHVYGSIAQANIVKVSFWNRHRVGLSTAASVMIVASVLLLNPNFNQHTIINADDSIPLAPSLVRPMPMSMNSVDSVSEQALTEQSAPASVQSEPTYQQKAEQMNPSSIPLSRSHFDNTAIGVNADKVPNLQPSSNAHKNTPSERGQVKVQSIKSASDLYTAPFIEHDSAPKAIAHLAELVDSNQLEQAERYLITIEQRFPKITNVEHPQFQQYQELKKRLTTH